MSVTAVALVPGAPLLVPALAAGSADRDAALREQVLRCVRSLDGMHGDLLVVGGAPVTGPVRGTWDWSGLGVQERGGSGVRLPLALAVGVWLVDQCLGGAPRAFFGVHDGESAGACEALGQQLTLGRDIRLLVVGDGSARRTDKAPGAFDARAEQFDREAVAALSSADTAALLGLGEGLARELLVSGRAPWQVLAGAAQDGRWRAELLAAEAPYGVSYAVASWARVGDRR